MTDEASEVTESNAQSWGYIRITWRACDNADSQALPPSESWELESGPGTCIIFWIPIIFCLVSTLAGSNSVCPWITLRETLTWSQTVSQCLNKLFLCLSAKWLHEMGLCLLRLPILSLNSPATVRKFFLLLRWNLRLFYPSILVLPSLKPQETIIDLFPCESPSSTRNLSSVGWIRPGPHWFAFDPFLVLDACLWMLSSFPVTFVKCSAQN